MDVHRMERRLDAVVDEIADGKSMPKQQARMNALDVQMIELHKFAERRCRKILKPDLEFSPRVQLWHERMQAYKALIQWKTCNARSSNIIRTALH